MWCPFSVNRNCVDAVKMGNALCVLEECGIHCVGKCSTLIESEFAEVARASDIGRAASFVVFEKWHCLRASV